MLSPVFAVFTCFPDTEVPVGFFPAVPVDVSFESVGFFASFPYKSQFRPYSMQRPEVLAVPAVFLV